MKRLVLAALLALSLSACVDDVDSISQEPMCVHIDFGGNNNSRYVDAQTPLDGVYCRDEVRP